ncbi:MAG: glucosaminidase domain-containing protein [Bacteroidales bacterium]
MQRLLAFIITVGLFFNAYGQSKITRQEYISTYSGTAIKQMKSYGVPASIILAQGMLESDNGNSTLAVEANNHFGIKCHKDWNGPTIYHDDDRKHECFRKYRNAESSFMDHSLFLRGSQRYATLFGLEPTDYKGWAYGLKAAGYATNPKYPEMLIKIIEDNKLYVFDKGVDVPVESLQKGNDIDGYTIDIYKTRPVYRRNGIKYVVVRDGDTFESLTKELNLMPWQLYRYNDLNRGDKLTAGEELYIQPKRNRANRGNIVHTVENGETMHSISQKYGIKLKKLYRKNNMKFGDEPEAGQTLNLRRRVSY